ncbi:heat shock factor protein 1-like [Plectropomus leopardus]|uniref:heat shock factor protein 1-like n=1 Tax=Plectropomus leopardus TaxID=160734 RepID=UPI001C4D362A|nr:heat shock factor protein 1-like [Plectropomus leopardus]
MCVCLQAAASLFSADPPVTSGPTISDITDVTSSDNVISDWTDAGESQSVSVKEEPSSPDLEVCPVLEGGPTSVDTPLSPTTFINSILQDNDTQTTPSTSAAVSPIILMSPASTGSLPAAPASQSPASIPTSNSSPTKPPQQCQTVACIDR